MTNTALVPLAFKPGAYTATLFAPDAAPTLIDRPDHALLFENDNVADAASGVSVLGHFTVR